MYINIFNTDNFIEMSKKQTKNSNRSQMKQVKKVPLTSQTERQEKLKKDKQALEAAYQQKMQNYMKKLEAKSDQTEKVAHYSASSIQKISENLISQNLIIPEIALPINIKMQKPVVLTYEQKKQLQTKQKRQNIQRKIEYINDQLKVQKQSAKQKSKETPAVAKQFFTKEQHEKKVQKIIQQKQQRKKRQQELKEQEQRKEKESQQRHEEQKKQQELLKQKKRTEIQQKIKKRKLEHDQFIQKSTSNVKDSVYLYEKMEKNYSNNIQMPLLQEKKNKLKQIRQFNKQYNVQNIKQHEKNYQNQSIEKSMVKKNTDPVWKYEAPAKISRLENFIHQEEKELKDKLEYRQHRIQEMKKAYLAFNNKMKKLKLNIDSQKRHQIEKRIQEEIAKNEKQQVEYDVKRIGLQYLQTCKKVSHQDQQARKLKRSQTVKSKLQTYQLQRAQSVKYLEKSRNIRSESYYEDARRKKIQQIINSQESNHEKYLQLKLQSDKLQYKLKQNNLLNKMSKQNSSKSSSGNHQSAELLVSSLKAKFGLINLMKGPINKNSEK